MGSQTLGRFSRPPLVKDNDDTPTYTVHEGVD